MSVFLPNGKVDPSRFRSEVIEPIASSSIRGLGERELAEAHSEIEAALESSTTSNIRQLVDNAFAGLSTSHRLVSSRRTLNRHGQRGDEWVYFDNRQHATTWSAGQIEWLHRQRSAKACSRIQEFCERSSTWSLSSEHPCGWDLLTRMKSEQSAQRKMGKKGLKPWQVGDWIGFTLVFRGLDFMATISELIDAEYRNEILTKQNGFHDSIVYDEPLDRAVCRRMFYIIRIDSIVCYELQLMTLRQLLYNHLSHPIYVAGGARSRELDHLYAYGDIAFSMDLMELAQSSL